MDHSVVWALTDLMITNQVKGMVAWEMARQEAMTPKDAPEPISPEFAIGSAGWAAQQAEPARTAGDADAGIVDDMRGRFQARRREIEALGTGTT